MAYKIRKKRINISKATAKIMEYLKTNDFPVSSVDKINIKKILKEEKQGDR